MNALSLRIIAYDVGYVEANFRLASPDIESQQGLDKSLLI